MDAFQQALEAVMAFVLLVAGPAMVVLGSVWIFARVAIAFLNRLKGL